MQVGCKLRDIKIFTSHIPERPDRKRRTDLKPFNIREPKKFENGKTPAISTLLGEDGVKTW